MPFRGFYSAEGEGLFSLSLSLSRDRKSIREWVSLILVKSSETADELACVESTPKIDASIAKFHNENLFLIFRTFKKINLSENLNLSLFKLFISTEEGDWILNVFDT